VAVTVTIGDVVIDVDAAAVGIIGADGVMAVLVKDVVLDINSAQRLPKDDSVGAIIGDDVVVNSKIGDGVITGNLKTVAGVGEEDVIDDDLVFAAEVQSVVEGGAGVAVVVNVIGAVAVAAGAFLRINAVQTLGGGVGGISVVMDVAVEDLIIVSPNSDSAFGSIFDFKPVDDIVAAVDVEADVTIGSVLSIDDSAAGNFGLERNGTGSGSIFAEVKSPATVVVGVGTSLYDDGAAGRSETVRLYDCAERLGRCSGIGIIARRGNVQCCAVRVNDNEQAD